MFLSPISLDGLVEPPGRRVLPPYSARANPGATAITTMKNLENILNAINDLEAAWESGDLAGAVRELCELRDEAREASAPEAVAGKSTHTPGPWKVNAGDSHLPRIDSSSGYIATTDCSMFSSKATWVHDCATTIANARLIAAAPELAEALEACADRLEEMACWLELEPARAALVKAGLK